MIPNGTLLIHKLSGDRGIIKEHEFSCGMMIYTVITVNGAKLRYRGDESMLDKWTIIND